MGKEGDYFITLIMFVHLLYLWNIFIFIAIGQFTSIICVILGFFQYSRLLLHLNVGHKWAIRIVFMFHFSIAYLSQNKKSDIVTYLNSQLKTLFDVDYIE